LDQKVTSMKSLRESCLSSVGSYHFARFFTVKETIILIVGFCRTVACTISM
jgi:hypothetical protein